MVTIETFLGPQASCGMNVQISDVIVIVPWLLNWTNQITQLEVDKSKINLIR